MFESIAVKQAILEHIHIYPKCTPEIAALLDSRAWQVVRK